MNEFKKIFQSILDGNEEATVAQCHELLEKGYSALDILEKGMIPAMDQSGVLLARQERFIPQVIISAQAMQSGIRLIRPLLLHTEHIAIHDAVVVGTVQGDIHNIGKSLVAIMLQSSGFQVIDLGTNVTAAEFSAAIRRHNARIVAMSAMLTTAMTSMRTTVQALRREDFGYPLQIVVGGAPITQNFAEELGVTFAGSILDTARTALALMSSGGATQD